MELAAEFTIRRGPIARNGSLPQAPSLPRMMMGPHSERIGAHMEVTVIMRMPTCNSPYAFPMAMTLLAVASWETDMAPLGF